MSAPGINHILKEMEESISYNIDNIGLHYRIFSRAKTFKSLKEKYYRKKKKYSKTCQLTDFIGIRIVTYFPEDCDIVIKLLKAKFECLEESVDSPETSEFKPKRTNFVFKIPSEFHTTFNEALSYFDDIDQNPPNDFVNESFEVQIRTILSEGWHEVEHSLKYKCSDDWKPGFVEEERMLNAIYATLENNSKMMEQLFDKLSHHHYNNKNFSAMIRNRLRINFEDSYLSDEVNNRFERNEQLRKHFLRINRLEALKKLSNIDAVIPLTMDNVVLSINEIFYFDKTLSELCPEYIKSKIN